MSVIGPFPLDRYCRISVANDRNCPAANWDIMGSDCVGPVDKRAELSYIHMYMYVTGIRSGLQTARDFGEKYPEIIK